MVPEQSQALGPPRHCRAVTIERLTQLRQHHTSKRSAPGIRMMNEMNMVVVVIIIIIILGARPPWRCDGAGARPGPGPHGTAMP
jgi:hypothetical protein